MSVSSVSKQIQEAWERLHEVSLATREGLLIPTQEVAFLRYVRSKGKVFLHTRKNQVYECNEDLESLKELLPRSFVQPHGYYLVNLEEIQDISGRPGNFRLHCRGVGRSVPISPTFEKRMKKHLGVTTFEHPVPDNPRARFLRQYGLIEFGERSSGTSTKATPRPWKPSQRSGTSSALATRSSNASFAVLRWRD